MIRERILFGWAAVEWFSATVCLLFSMLISLPVPVWFGLIPDPDIGREEARRIQTWNETRRIAIEIAGSHETAISRVTSETDVWGHPYRLEKTSHGNVRVVSAGVDGVFDSTSARVTDDIHFQMISAPVARFRSERRTGWCISLSIWVLTGTAVFLLIQRR